MSPSPSLFARKLKSWRASHGKHGRVTQETLADLLDVSVDAIGKYERSVSFIRGDLEHRLADRLGWARSEIQACREDWEIRQRVPRSAPYRLVDDAVVNEVFSGSWDVAVEVMNTMAADQFAGLPVECAAENDVFAPIYNRYRNQWRAIEYQGQIVAIWVCLTLYDDDEAEFRKRRLIECDLTVDSVCQPILPGTYFGYSTAVVVCPGHEAVSTLLVSSFTDYIEELAMRDVLFHSIGTIAVSKGGEQMCRGLGMEKLGPFGPTRSFSVWELSGAAMANSLFARRSAIVRRSYSNAFLS